MVYRQFHKSRHAKERSLKLIPADISKRSFCAQFTYRQVLITCQGRNRKWVECTAGVIDPVIRNFLVFDGFSMPYIVYSYLWQAYIKQTRECVCRIWRKTWMEVSDFCETRKAKLEAELLAECWCWEGRGSCRFRVRTNTLVNCVIILFGCTFE